MSVVRWRTAAWGSGRLAKAVQLEERWKRAAVSCSQKAGDDRRHGGWDRRLSEELSGLSAGYWASGGQR